MRKGILGGTFDPIHNAHISIARIAAERFGLDEVLFITAGDPYFKSGSRAVTPGVLRHEMVSAAAADLDFNTSACDIEVRREGPSYTADTLEELHKAEPETELYFITGADTLDKIHKWYRPKVVFENAVILAANRDGQIPAEKLHEQADFLRHEYGASIEILTWEGNDLSSSDCRKMLENGIYPAEIPDSALHIIRENRLYDTISDSDIIKDLTELIKPERIRHTQGVAETAYRLAKIHGCSAEKAKLAGLLHDCGKGEGDALTHAAAGAKIANERFGIKDEEILNAIRLHTTGAPGMSLLEKIIYIADYIEPGRSHSPQLPKLREVALTDIDGTVADIAGETLDYLTKKGAAIDENTVLVYNYYKYRQQAGKIWK